MSTPPLRIPVHAYAGADGSGPQPLTFGVPFADGALPAGAPLRAVTADGRELPLQTACMTTWNKDLKFVKWLLADLLADPARDGETIWLAIADPPDSSDLSDPSDPTDRSDQISTTAADGILTIDTGVLRLRLRTDFAIWKHRENDSVFAGCEIKTAAGWRPAWRGEGIVLTMKDARGNRYDSSGDNPAPRVVVEEQGPLRVCVRIDGHLRSEAGVLFCPYRLRLHLYAGKADLRIFHTFVFNQDPTRVELAGIGLKVLACPGDDARAAIGADSPQDTSSPYFVSIPSASEEDEVGRSSNEIKNAAAESATADGLSLLQSDDLHYTVARDGERIGAGEKAAGWAALSGADTGVVAAVRDFWQEYPKGFRIERDALDIQIWPEDYPRPLSFLTPFREPAIRFSEHPDEAEIKRVLADHPTAPLHLRSSGSPEEIRRIEATVDRYAPERPRTYSNTGTNNGIGAAKTTEVLLRFSDGPIANEAAAALAAAVRNPSVAVVDPVYLCGTGALEHILAAGDPRFKAVDAYLDDGHFEFCVRDPVERHRLYGMMRYGNLICLHGGVPDNVYQAYKDTEPEKALRYFGPFNNEACDQILSVWCHFFRTGDPLVLRFAQLASRATADVGFVHAYPDDSDCIGVIHYHNAHPWSGVLCRSHSIVGGIMADYYLTGNRRLLDVAIEAADQVVRVQNPAGILNCFYGNEMNREFVGPLSILMEAYQATWRECYGALAERSLAWLLRTVRTPGRLPQSVFTVGPRGDEAVVYADGYPEIFFGNHYQAYADALRLFASNELKAFLVAEADYWVWRYPGGGGSPVVCLAYDITADPVYAACLAAGLERIKPSDPAASQDAQPRHWGTYNCIGSVPRLMKTVAQAMDRDADGFADRIRQWKERRKPLPDRVIDSRSPRSGETHLGTISAEPFMKSGRQNASSYRVTNSDATE